MKTIPILILMFVALRVFAQDTTYIEYATVLDHGTWRYIDRQGNFMFGKDVESVEFCDDGLIKTSRGGRTGFLDLQYREVIPFAYDAADCFERGYARVAVDKKWGFIDRHGKYLVEPTFEYAGNFTGYGLAGVIQGGKLGFIDTTGRLAIPFRYWWINSFTVFPHYPQFSNGLIAVADDSKGRDGERGKMGFMNMKGELAIAAIYDIPGPFSLPVFYKGRTVVSIDRKSIMIDTTGRKIADVDQGAEEVLFQQDSLKVFKIESGRTGLINDRGDTLLEPKYNGIGLYSEGFAAVQIRSTKTGVVSAFVDRAGKFAFGREFEFIRSFNEGLAAVQIGERWGYIDTTGRTVIAPNFLFAFDFDSGRAAVVVGTWRKNGTGMIDRTGAIIIKPVFQTIGRFNGGMAPAQLPGKGGLLGGLYGFIDERGKWVIPPRFQAARDFVRLAIPNR
jgi:hypothetical protein